MSTSEDNPTVLFPKPAIVIYRFLDVIKPKDELILEYLRYVEKNLYDFLRAYWEEPDLKALIDLLRNESYIDGDANPDVPVIFQQSQSTFAIQDSIVMYVLWKCYKCRQCIDIGHDNPALQKLIHYVVLDGVISNRFQLTIEDHIIKGFEYVASENIPQFIMSNIAHRLFEDQRILSLSEQNNGSKFFNYIDNIFNTRTKDTYVTLANVLRLPPCAILLVAFSGTEAKKAARAGYMVAKVRELNQPPPKYYTIRVVDNISCIRFVEINDVAAPTSNTKNK